MHRTDNWCTRFLQAKALRSKATKARYRTVLGRLSCFQSRLPIKTWDITRFLADVLGTADTLDTYYRTLSTFYHWLESQGIKTQWRQVERPKFRPTVPRILSLAELNGLLAARHAPRDRALLLVLADTGMRVGEAAGLEWHHVGDGLLTVSGKTGGRMVPIIAATLNALYALAHPEDRHGPVFWGKKGPLTTSGIKQTVKRAFRAVGLTGPRASAHTLRHTFATFWEGDELILAQILGHKTLRMVQRYRQFRLERAILQHQQFSPVARLASGLQLPFSL